MDIIASEPNNRADNHDSKKDTDQQKVISDDWLNNRGLGVLGKTRLMIVMSFLFVAPFLVIWLIRNGPFNTGSYLTILITLIVNILLVTLAIHFVVLVHVMHSVLTTNKKDPIWIEYKPFHPDMAAGFRDFGRFATRVNGLLILGAMYLGYRSFVQGRLAFVSRDTTFSVAAIDSLWIINYLLPVIAYLIVVFLWSYYSFYIIHRAMKRGKQRRLNRILTSEFDETDHYSEWESVKSGPVWPINDRLVVALLSADLVSFAIALVALFS